MSVDGAMMLGYRSAAAPRGMTAVGEFVADAETRIVRLVPRGASFAKRLPGHFSQSAAQSGRRIQSEWPREAGLPLAFSLAVFV